MKIPPDWETYFQDSVARINAETQTDLIDACAEGFQASVAGGFVTGKITRAEVEELTGRWNQAVLERKRAISKKK